MNKPLRHRPEFCAGSPAKFVTRAGGFYFGFYFGASAMAGDWIKMRHDLGDDPAVITLIAETSCVDADHVVGKLHKLWSWADRQSRKGHAPGVTPQWLDTFLGCQGFAKVLKKVGWLRVTDEDIVIPKFDRHMSKSAKNRALAARRKVTQRSRTNRDNVVTREEKRREETSLDRSIRFDSNDRRHLDSISWEETAELANRAARKLIDGQVVDRVAGTFRPTLFTAAALVQCGLMPAAALAETIQAMIVAKPKRPGGYFGKVLADKFERWDILRAAVTLPGKDGD